jgi:hypothetical protein
MMMPAEKICCWPLCVTLTALLAGCSASPSAGYPPASFQAAAADLLVARVAVRPERRRARFVGRSWARRSADVFISDAENGVVDGYDIKTKERVEEITGFTLPQGLATDRAGNLYVADTGASVVYVFSHGATEPSLVLNDAGWAPTGVAVSTSGEVAVANIHSVAGGLGSVTFYAPGKTQPFATVSGPQLLSAWFCAYDGHGNLFADGGEGPAQVVEIAHGGSQRALTSLGIANIDIPGGIQVLRNGDILLGDQLLRIISRYWRKHPEPVGETFLASSSDPVSFALTGPHEDFLYDADYALAETMRFAFPGGRASRSIAVAGLPSGIAVVPWARP